jgi:mannose-6-phosphate isomerase
LLKTLYLYPLQLEASIHETIWGGDRLRLDGWKHYSPEKVAVGEAWETETSTIVQNGPYQGKTLGELVEEQGSSLLGQQAIALFGQRFPLLAKFIDANLQLSVQVHPSDRYAREHEGGKLGKTEFWYILKAQPGATIVHGFKRPTTRAEVEAAIRNVTLDQLLHEETVQAGDVIFVPSGTVHAIGAGILLYELQEYSDVTYRMYDYGRLSASGTPRELHVERALDVAHYTVSPQIKVQPTLIADTDAYEDRHLLTCPYFTSHEIQLKQRGALPGVFTGETDGSCMILSSLGAEARVCYGTDFDRSESLTRGQSLILPAALGAFRLEGRGKLLYSYVP